MFKWICFGVGLTLGLSILILLYSLKRNVTAKLETANLAVTNANEAISTVNLKLPEIVREIRQGTTTLSELAEDVALLKSVAGITNAEQDRGLRGLATYADAVQKLLADKTSNHEASLWIEEIIGSDLKRVESFDEFLVGLNRELVFVVLPISKSKQEVLFRISHSGPPRRKPYFVKVGDAEPVRLDEYIKSNHPESAQLPPYEK